jgi:O-antigen ligase
MQNRFVIKQPIASGGGLVAGLNFTEFRRTCAALPPVVVRYIFCALVFFIPLEVVLTQYIGNGTRTPSKYLGYLLVAVSITQPRLCYGRIPKALGFLVAYVLISLMFGFLVQPPSAVFTTPEMSLTHITTSIQMFVFFYISYNLMLSDRFKSAMLWSLGLSCTLLAALQALGITRREISGGRVTVGEADANAVATILALGLIALIGVGFARKNPTWPGRIFLPSAVLLVMQIVVTGSRGGAVALGAALLTLLSRKGAISKLKVAVIVVMMAGTLIGISLESAEVRVRWIRTFNQGDMALRENIYPVAWRMFLDSPVVGWGTGNLEELSRRLGELTDFHNEYLWILNEVGLIGAIPFILWIAFAIRASWKARSGSQEVVPIAMLVCILIACMSLTVHQQKYFWLVFAYVYASAAAPSAAFSTSVGMSFARMNQWQPMVGPGRN